MTLRKPCHIRLNHNQLVRPTEEELLLEQKPEENCRTTPLQVGQSNTEFLIDNRAFLVRRWTADGATQVVVSEPFPKRAIKVRERSVLDYVFVRDVLLSEGDVQDISYSLHITLRKQDTADRDICKTCLDRNSTSLVWQIAYTSQSTCVWPALRMRVKTNSSDHSSFPLHAYRSNLYPWTFWNHGQKPHREFNM